VNAGRTSNTAWCYGECERDETVQQLYQKIEEVTGVPFGNYEGFQVNIM
jgi:hypothetical protein